MKYDEWKINYYDDNGTGLRSLPPLLRALLTTRGLSGLDDLRDSFVPGSDEALVDMGKAVARITRAIENMEKTAVYGDYDVDGITSAYILTDYLRSRALPVELYIPDRFEEGYGLNMTAVEFLRDKGATLIITVDCGITAQAEVEFATSLGVDMIITDHHECKGELPNAVAVIDPKRPDDSGAPLAGVGVTYKLIAALEGNRETVLDRYSDFIALATVADVMPLTGENRFLVEHGLEKMNDAPSLGISALIREAGIASPVTSSSIAYGLAPRINAAGRLGRSDTAAQLFLSRDPNTASRLAAELCDLNRARQELEAEIWTQAISRIGDTRPTEPLVLASEKWHQGVMGIVASRLVELYCVPAIMISLDGDVGRGSCRSCDGFNIYSAISACSDWLVGYGGHAQAAGFSIRRDCIDGFRDAMTDYFHENFAATVSELSIDFAIRNPAWLSSANVEALDRLEPYGNGNPKAILCLLDAEMLEITDIGGGKHLRLTLAKFGALFDCVFFGVNTAAVGLRAGDRIDAAFTPQINDFRGRRTVQLVIRDLRKAENISENPA